MKTYITTITALILLINISCEKSENTGQPKILTISKTTEKIIDSDNEFGIDLFKKVAENFAPEENVFISPVSAALALAMTYNGANTTTRDAMEITLKKTGLSTGEINESYLELMNGLKSTDPKVILNVANSIWYRDDFYVLPDFIQTNNNYYNAEVNAEDFSNPETVTLINNWVSDKTTDKIDKIIDEISPEAVMFLINAIYFNGTWKVEFKESDTKPMDFYPENGINSFKVDMMAVKDTFNYFSNEIFESVEIPYGYGNYNMVVFLPRNGKTVSDVANSFSFENWENWLTSMTEKEVEINFPKFRFAFEDTLNDELSDMGMGIAFTPLADFTKINPDGGLLISFVKQKTYIDVNEKGTEAAAVTIVGIEFTSIGNSINFVVNRPFLFVITEKQTKSIVFIGKVAKPEYKS